MSIALTSYLLALAVFIPASGLLADRYGSRTVFRSAIALFVAGSLACGQAPTLGAMVLARFLQGMGGAMMIPVGRLVLLRSVAKQDMVNAMSWLLVPALVGPVVGRRWAASSSLISTGAGSSTSTCRSACSGSAWSAASSPISAKTTPRASMQAASC
jgi:MFS family permease